MELANVDTGSFAYRDITGQDKWVTWTPVASITVVGTPTYTGRFRIVGRQCFWQISAVASTSIATTAGTSYFELPVTAKGTSGMATMVNASTNIAVGVGVIDVANSRVYPPSQAANASVFHITGWNEV